MGSRLTPDQGVSEKKVSSKCSSRQQLIARAADLTQRLPRVLQWRTDAGMTMQATQRPAHWKRSSGDRVVRKLVCTIEPDNREDATRPQEIAEMCEGWSQGKVVQRCNHGDEIEAAGGEWVRHHITLEEGDTRR